MAYEIPAAEWQGEQAALRRIPEVSFGAREQRETARKLLAVGGDPGKERDEKGRHRMRVAENTFEEVARDWHRLNLKKWHPQTAENISHRFEIDLFPMCGALKLAEVKVPDILDALHAVEKRGALEVAKRLTANCSRVFNYDIRSRLTERSPAALLSEVLEPREKVISRR